MNEKMFQNLETVKPKIEESPLKNQENLMTLFLKLQNVYNTRPDITEFEGAMADTKFANEYTPEEIQANLKWVTETRSKIEEANREKGQELFSHFEENFAFAEAGQAMIVDRLNVWMPDFATTMTSFDVTVSSNKDNINNKLTKNWDNNISKGMLPVVKYAEDPETGKKGRLITPKFIVGVSADDINELASAYLAGEEQSLDKHPVRKLILEQIRVQYNDALDFYESDENKDDARFNLVRREYARVKEMIDAEEKKLDESQAIDRLGYHEYAKKSLTLGLINDFANKKK